MIKVTVPDLDDGQLDDLQDDSNRELEQMPIEAERIANRLVPVDTGALKESITINLTEHSIVAGEDYAVFVEFGTVKMAPQPFLGPAARQAFEDGVRRLRDGSRRR